MKNFKIELNNPNNIRDLLQTAYRLAEEQIIQAQNEINKLSNSTTLQNEPMMDVQNMQKPSTITYP